MNATKYLLTLYQKHVTEINFNIRIKRDLERHNWLITKYENVKPSEENTQSEYEEDNENQLNGRIRRDLNDNTWQTKRRKKRKLKKKSQNSKDIAKQK